MVLVVMEMVMVVIDVYSQGTSSFRITRTLFASCTPSKQDQLGIKILRKDFAEVRHFLKTSFSLPTTAGTIFEHSTQIKKALLLNQIRAQKYVIKSVFCNFLLDFNRLLKKKKNILKRPRQTATTTIFKGNPPKQTKNTKIQKK